MRPSSLLPLAGAPPAATAMAAAAAPTHVEATAPGARASGAAFDRALRTACGPDAAPTATARPRPNQPANDPPSAVGGRQARGAQESPKRSSSTNGRADDAVVNDEHEEARQTAQGPVPVVPEAQAVAQAPVDTVPCRPLDSSLAAALDAAMAGGITSSAPESSEGSGPDAGATVEDVRAGENTAPTSATGTPQKNATDLSARSACMKEPLQGKQIDTTVRNDVEAAPTRSLLDGAPLARGVDASETAAPSQGTSARSMPSSTGHVTHPQAPSVDATVTPAATETNVATTPAADTRPEPIDAAAIAEAAVADSGTPVAKGKTIEREQASQLPDGATAAARPAAAHDSSQQHFGGEDPRGRREPDSLLAARSTPALPHSLTLVASPDGTLRLAPVMFAAPTIAAMLPEHETVNLDRMVQTMRIMVKDNVSEATVHLNPEHFGDVRLQIRVDGKSVSTIVHTENADVREWLQGQESSLRSSLSEQGLQLETLVVQRDGRQDRRDTAQQQAERRRARMRQHTEGEPRFEVSV